MKTNMKNRLTIFKYETKLITRHTIIFNIKQYLNKKTNMNNQLNAKRLEDLIK